MADSFFRGSFDEFTNLGSVQASHRGISDLMSEFSEIFSAVYCYIKFLYKKMYAIYFCIVLIL